MATNVFNRIQRSVKEKRRNVDNWLETAAELEKECCLASEDVQNIQEHLHVLDETLEKAESQTLGVCEVCHRQVDDSLLEVDYTASICLECLSDEEKRQLETELEFSREVQRALLPQQVPTIQGLDMAAFNRPAQIVGGDYFDFFEFRNGLPGLVIADVMGHGVSASLLMSSLQAALRTLIPEDVSTSAVMQRVNRYYLHNINLTTFVTAFLGQYDPAKHVLTYSNAGHNPPLLYRKQAKGNGRIAWLEPTGAAIGLMEEYEIRTETVDLHAGDVLLLYTDGITEAVNPTQEQFGRERLADLIARSADLPAQDLVAALRRELNEFINGGTLADDVTILACKVPG